MITALKIKHIEYFVLAIMLFGFTPCLPERDNPWDEKSIIAPEDWAPKNLTLKDNADNSVTITWEYDGSPLIEGFILDRKEGEGAWVEGFAILPPNQLSYTDNAVKGGQKWTYRLYSNVGSTYSLYTEADIYLKILDGTIGAIVYNNYSYKTVYINGREWMAENLQTTMYNDGSNIPNVTDNETWVNLTSPAYCWYNNDKTTYGYTYGALYNWCAVSTGKLCPTGWHVPTDSEWNELTTYVGGISVAANKLKATNGWGSDGNGTDEYNFTALPGGNRWGYGGTFYYLDNTGFWWSNTESNALDAWLIRMHSDDENVTHYANNKNYGFSVRCIKDND